MAASPRVTQGRANGGGEVHLSSLCLEELELARALTLGASRSEQKHLDTCASCRARWDGYRRAIDAAHELYIAASAGSREQVRTAVLASMAAPAKSTKPLRLRLGLVGGAATAVIIVLVMVLHADNEAPPGRASGVIGAAARASFDHMSTAPGEVVHQADRPAAVLAAGQSRTPDAQSGAARGQAPARSAPKLAVVRRTYVAPPPVVLRSTTSTPRSALEPITLPERPADEVAYDAAWSAMRQSDFATAATQFARVVAQAPGGSLAPDAAYFRAIALARAGRADEAIAQFRVLLDGMAATAHRGEGSAALGWLLVNAHHLAEARQRFEVATHDGNAQASASGRAGLDAIERGHGSGALPAERE